MAIGVGGLSALLGRAFAAVLFDLDGTLIDSTPAVERSWARWAVERGIPRTGFTVSHGVPARQVLRTFLPEPEVEAGLARIEQLEMEDLTGVVLLPGALAALGALGAGAAAIVTSGTVALATTRIRATGLPVPAVLVTASDVAVGKPDPAPYLLAAARLGVDPARCLVVEDAPAGLVAGRAAGCATLALATTHPVQELHPAADAVVASLAAVRLVQQGGAGGSIGVHPVPPADGVRAGG